MMGYIKHFDCRLQDLQVGWVDDKDVRGKYEKAIVIHASVRSFGELFLLLSLSSCLLAIYRA